MKLRDGLTLAAIVGCLALIFLITWFDQPEPASQAEREAACRVSVLQADRLNPENRPLKH